MEQLEGRQLLALTVTTLVDENDGVAVGGVSLREAIAAAVADETIDFAPSLTATSPAIIRLTRGQLVINKGITITGPGASLLTVDASGNDSTPNVNEGNGSRVFNIDDGTATLKTVSINKLSLTGGDANGAGGAILARENLTLVDCVITGNATSTAAQLGGGGIYSAALSGPATSLTLLNCTLTGNAATQDEGGAIRKRRGSLTMENCTVSGNTSYSHGGGMSVADGGVQVQIRSCSFSGNRATNFYGGGIFFYSAVATLTSSTISGNTALTGGGLYSTTSSNVTMTGCTVSGNAAVYDGGGAYVISSQLTITNSTLSTNRAVGFGGGAIAVSGGSLNFKHSTVVANRSNTDNAGGEQGGGIILSATGSATLDHTIVAGNLRGTATRSDAIGQMTLRFSIIGDGTGLTRTDQGGNLIGSATFPVDARLSPLADNGGPTLTHALLPDSFALNAGDPGLVSGQGATPMFDQRGKPLARVFGDRIDIGAVESQPSPADFDSDGDVDGSDFLRWQRGVGASGSTANRANGDADLDFDVDGVDLAFWRSSFGGAATAPAAVAGARSVTQPVSHAAVDAAMAVEQAQTVQLPRRRWRPSVRSR
jgi:hypothetical protein